MTKTMPPYRKMLLSLLTCLSCACLQAKHIEILSDSTHFSTSYDDKYNIKLHIENQYIYVDQVPQHEIFTKYMFGIRDAFNLEGRGYKISPANADWLVCKEYKENKPMRISCRGLEDGLYEVGLHIKKRHADEYWNYTQPYDIVIKVRDKQPVFVGATHIKQTKETLSHIPTDSTFLQRCLQPTEMMQIESPIFKQLVAQLVIGEEAPRVCVQRALDWVAFRLIMERSFGPSMFRKVDALTAIKQRQTTRDGFAIVTAATLRAIGVPALVAPISNLLETSLWYNKKFRTGRRNIVLAYYENQWRLIDAMTNNDDYMTSEECLSESGYRSVHRGIDLTPTYFSNRSRLLYAHEFRLAVESYLHPIEIVHPAITALSADSIDALPSTHLTTSYCKPYTITMHVEDNKEIVLDHLPQLPNFSQWESQWTSSSFRTLLSNRYKKKSIYDRARWNIKKWKANIYQFNLYDIDRLGYATKECIRLKKDGTGAAFITDEEGTKNNRQALKAIPMTASKRREMLQNSLYYNTKDTAVVRIAKAVTKGMTDDYEKMAAIHQWVSKNIYFDKDVYNTHKDFYKYNKVPLVMKNRRCVGNGYAYVACSMMRAVGIPAVGMLNKLKKKAPGASGHVILVAYYKGRWVIMDPASDSWNKYENGTFQPQLSTPNRMLYFDTTLAFMSQFRELQKPLDHSLKAKVKIQRTRRVVRKVIHKRS